MFLTLYKTRFLQKIFHKIRKITLFKNNFDEAICAQQHKKKETMRNIL